MNHENFDFFVFEDAIKAETKEECVKKLNEHGFPFFETLKLLYDAKLLEFSYDELVNCHLNMIFEKMAHQV